MVIIKNKADDAEQERQIKLERLRQLKAGPGNRAGMFGERKGTCLITAEEVNEIKECLDSGLNGIKTVEKTGLSEYYVRNTKKGLFDYLLE